MTGMVGRFAKEAIPRKKGPLWASSVDAYGKAAGGSDTIHARTDPKVQRVTGSDGQDVQVTVEVITEDEVRVGDVLTIGGTEQTAITAAPQKDLAGTVQFWTVTA
jgi:hypothetical protein